MQITKTKIKVSELCQGYADDGDGGIYNIKFISRNNRFAFGNLEN